MSIHKKNFPNVDDIVFVLINDKIKSERGTYCNLIEYNNLEGFILNTELDKWTRDDKRLFRISDQKKFKEKQIYCARVMAVNMRSISEPNLESNLEPNSEPNSESNSDSKLGNEVLSIDLSYKKIAIDTREKLVENFGYMLKIKQLCDEFVYFSKVSFDLIYDKTIRSIFDSTNFNLENSKQIYYSILKNPEELTKNFVNNFNEHTDISMKFIENMKSRITYTKMTMEQHFELLIYDTDAITKLREILSYNSASVKLSESEETFVECISSPKYKIITNDYSIESCNSNIERCFEFLKERSKEYKAIISTKNDPFIVKQQDIYIRNLNMQK